MYLPPPPPPPPRHERATDVFTYDDSEVGESVSCPFILLVNEKAWVVSSRSPVVSLLPCALTQPMTEARLLSN